MLRAGLYHADHGRVFPHPQFLGGHITFLSSSPEYRAVSGISNAILGAFRLRIGVMLYMLVSVENLWVTLVALENYHESPLERNRSSH